MKGKLLEELLKIPQIQRGQVWCKTCGHPENVNGRNCLQNGWPRCCGHTMTIDSPEETLKFNP